MSDQDPEKPQPTMHMPPVEPDETMEERVSSGMNTSTAKGHHKDIVEKGIESGFAKGPSRFRKLQEELQERGRSAREPNDKKEAEEWLNRIKKGKSDLLSEGNEE